MGQVKSHISNYFKGETPVDDINIKDYDVGSIQNQKSLIKVKVHHESVVPFYGITATPRNPLKRSRHISPSASLPQSITEIFSPTKKIKYEEDYLNFPFLQDAETVSYYRKSKVMIILRGLPGSGKSTIAKALNRKYISSTICSADNFFMIDGVYKYDKSLIKDAHNECKKNAVNAVKDQISVVIIDNTNLKLWEIEFYLDLAKQYNYIPVITESKTPWRRDIPTLVKKTEHNISADIMEFKHENFEELQPLYYGWFLNDADSQFILEDGYLLICSAFEINEFRKDVKEFSGINSLEEFKHYFKTRGNRNVLHCTAKYIGKQLTQENVSYMDTAQPFIGKAYDVEVVGYVLTPRTFGARIKLSSDQLLLWGKDDTEEVPAHFLDVKSAEVSESDRKDSCFETKDPSEGEKGDDVENSSLNGGNLENGENGKEAHTPNEKEKNLKGTIESSNSEIEGGEEANRSFSGISNGFQTEDLGNGDSSPAYITVNHNKCSPKFPKKSPKSKKDSVLVPENLTQVRESLTVASAKLIETEISLDQKFTPTKGKGSRAHLTLGCAPKVKPVTTGFDLIFAIQKEALVSNNIDVNGKDSSSLDNIENSCPPPFSTTTDVGTICGYGHGVWVFYPKEKVTTKSIFTCEF